MPAPTLSYSVADFVPFTKISSADVNSKFDDIKTFVDTLSVTADDALTTADAVAAKFPANPTALSYATISTGGVLAAVRLPEFSAGSTSGATKTINFASGPTQKLTVTQACEITLSGGVDGESYVLILVQSGGSFSPTWVAQGGYTLKWSNAVAPIASADGKTDIVSLFYSGSTIYGSFISNF